MTKPPPSPADWQELTKLAEQTRARSYSPYSGFAVGAALATSGGLLFSGCNVENRSYGMTICAERTAVVSAVAAGERTVRRIVILADTKAPPRPCGLCLDTLAEFASPELEIRLINLSGNFEDLLLRDLLPQPFLAKDLPALG